MPIVIFVIVSVIFMAFYLHDRSRVRNILDYGADIGGLYARWECSQYGDKIYFEKIKEQPPFFRLTGRLDRENRMLREWVREKLHRNFYLSYSEEPEITITHQTVLIRMPVRLILPVKQVIPYFKRKRYFEEARAAVHNPAEFVRIYDTLGELIQK